MITGWRRCARWVDEDRAGLLVHRRLTRRRAGVGAARAEHGRALPRGPAGRGDGVAGAAPGRLNRLEKDFLDAAARLDRAQRRPAAAT